MARTFDTIIALAPAFMASICSLVKKTVNTAAKYSLSIMHSICSHIKRGWLKIVLYQGPLINFIWSIVAALIPLWLGLLLLAAYGKWDWNWLIFLEKGEFYLYSAAFLTNSIYILRKRKSDEGDAPFMLTLTASLLLVVVAALYASLNTSQTVFLQSTGFTSKFLAWSSMITFAASIAFSLYALVTDFDPSKLPTNRDIRETQVSELETAFDNIIP